MSAQPHAPVPTGWPRLTDEPECPRCRLGTSPHPTWGPASALHRPDCPILRGGYALVSTTVMGDEGTCSVGGPGRLVAVEKCPECGYSRTPLHAEFLPSGGQAG